MIKNYIKTAFRTLTKNRSYSAINIFGLALSLSAAILILLWVWDELSYDRMHNKGDRTYVMTATLDPNGGDIWYNTPSTIAVFGKNEIPAIEAAARINDGSTKLVEYQGRHFQESVRHVDPEFFQIFDFPFIAGNREHPFANLHSVVISKSIAKKYFGDTDPVGKIIQIGKTESYEVSAVIEDMPNNSSLQYDILFPFELLGENGRRDLNSNWSDFNYETYLLLKPESDPLSVSQQLTKIHVDNNSEYADILKEFRYGLFPFLDIHLKGDSQRHQQVRIFMIVALVILLIACINYVNLVTARSTRRSKEVSIRKVVGANKTHLFWQFISESVVVFLIAMVIAIGLIYLTMPLYNELSGKEMLFSLLDSKVWILFGASMLVVLLMAGVYPALILSTFKPALALKGIIPGLGKNNGFRKALVVVQFTCSVVLIVSTIVIGKQLAYIRQLNLGYDKENTMMFKRHNFGNLETIKSELKNQPGILGVTASSLRLDDAQSFTTSIDWEGKPASMNQYTINQLSVDHDFIDVMGMELVTGKGFTGTPADSAHYILNETALKQIGIEDPIGKPLTHQGKPGTIVGIVKDFHFRDMKNAIGPVVLFTTWGWDNIYVRTTAKDAKQAVEAIEKLWKQYNADYEFDYTFMDETFDRQYREDIRTGMLFNIFAGIAILLSCLGLFGLVTYTAETKVKEIGIRKTLGASISNIILLISKDFLKLVAISFVVAFPLGWWMMNSWLENYVYHTGVEWWVFAAAGLAAFAIAAITVCGKSLKAARENPIKAIRTE
ncbi:ABC transporter permease [Parapedobacter tibetensis]|uniref:ABC transporter permease n=1 Tax=Parapedobacter tibetensis TaxID=2972951 RepID=UPI00214D6B8B|nr:ABC transporter permease [Parapedobacter tibetensis]